MAGCVLSSDGGRAARAYLCRVCIASAGRLTLGYYQGGLQALCAEFKADHSPVTIADRKAEELIRERIEARYPGHAMVGEEFGATGSEGASHRWFIDPIDGTKAFARGVPLYAVLLGLEVEGQVRVGAAYYPALDEMLAGAAGLGAWRNGRRAHVSEVQRLDEANISCSDVASFAAHGRARAWDRLQAATYHRTGWSDAYGYLLVATGRIELMLDPVMNAWDCGPFPPIFEEAGGLLWRLAGQPHHLCRRGPGHHPGPLAPGAGADPRRRTGRRLKKETS